jgi:LysR family nitrogen assimilation transcriptional regulator
MDIRQLRYFVTIVDSGSMGKAAEKLFVAQPSLSQQIAKLEEELNTVLLIRGRRGVNPTAQGQALYRHGRLVIRQMEQLSQEIKQSVAQETGTVAIGLPTTMAAVLAMPLFERVQERYPGIRLQFFESMSGYINELLANGRLDLAILFRDADTLGVSSLPLLDEELCLMGEPGPHVSGRSKGCFLRQLSGVKLVAPSHPNGLRLLIERVFAKEEVELNIVADMDSLPMLISIAHSGRACTILPVSALAHRDAKSVPKVRRLGRPALQRPASVCWSNAVAMNSATVAVREAIVQLVGELHASGAWTGITLRA